MKKEFNICIENESAYITTPYNRDFVEKVKNLGGRWNSERREWKVNTKTVDAVREAMMGIYGRTDEEVSETVTVIVRFEEDVHSDAQESYSLFGRTIARAFGRDSGAKVGEGVAFTDGGATSGGSAKNWCVSIEAGSVAEIYDVPKDLAVKCMENLPEGMTAEIKGAVTIDREALIEEKEKLLARLAEIEKLLA